MRRWLMLMLVVLAVAGGAYRGLSGGGVPPPPPHGTRRYPADLDRAGRVPAYLQLAQLLRQEIVTGQLAPGEPVPSQNGLSAAYAVSVETARRAVEVLRGEGLVVTRRGAGSYAAAPPPRITVHAGPADVVTARMPTRAERAALGLAEGVPVLSVTRPGRAAELYDANRAEIIMGPLPEPAEHPRGGHRPDHPRHQHGDQRERRDRGQRRAGRAGQPAGHSRSASDAARA